MRHDVLCKFSCCADLSLLGFFLSLLGKEEEIQIKG